MVEIQKTAQGKHLIGLCHKIKVVRYVTKIFGIIIIRETINFIENIPLKASSEMAVPFSCRKEVTMAEQKTICCPRCGRKIGVWDGRSTMNLALRCKKCKKQVIYHVDNGVLEIKKLPQRNTSSGMSFC